MQKARYQAFTAAMLAICLLGVSTAASAVVLVDDNGAVLNDAVIMVDGVPARHSATAVMDQLNMQFQPKVLTVATGTEVNFPNSDDVRHHVYSFSAAKRFELRLFKGTEAPPVAFEQPGVVILGCNIHDNMLGYILVTDSAWFQTSDAAGVVDVQQLPQGKWPVSWWHPSLGESAPIDLGSLDLHATAQLKLPVSATPVTVDEAPLSPLQQRFRKAAGHDAH